MVRILWVFGLIAALAQAQEAEQLRKASVDFDTSPMVIDDLNSTLAITPAVLHPDSPLLSLRSGRLQKRRKIDVVVAGGTVVIAAGTIIIAGNAGLSLYDDIAAKIKAKSNANSCTLIHGTESDDRYYEGYAYQATTTGHNCDTTALLKTIEHAVQQCATDLNKAKAVAGCCRFSHGGTWHGHLRLTSNPHRFPANSVNC